MSFLAKHFCIALPSVNRRGTRRSADTEQQGEAALVRQFFHRDIPENPEKIDESYEIVSLIGRRGAGKTSLVTAYADEAWMDHERRRQMLRPGIRHSIVSLARQVIARAFAMGILREEDDFPDDIRQALMDLVRPLHVGHISTKSVLLLHHFGMFSRLLVSSRCALTADEGYFNAWSILVEGFPSRLFEDPDYVPTVREVRLCRAPSTFTTEAKRHASKVKLIDCPGAVDNDGHLIVHEYAVEFPSRTTPVLVVSLHSIGQTLDYNKRTFARISEFIEGKGFTRIGLILTYIDDVEDIIAPAVETDLKSIADALISVGGRPVIVCVCSALDVGSAAVALSGLCAEKALFRSAQFGGSLFSECGIVPHMDKALSEAKSRPIMWARSVFPTRERWTSSQFGLLPPKERKLVLQLMMMSKRKESPMSSLPITALYHIASFIVSTRSVE